MMLIDLKLWMDMHMIGCAAIYVTYIISTCIIYGKSVNKERYFALRAPRARDVSFRTSFDNINMSSQKQQILSSIDYAIEKAAWQYVLSELGNTVGLDQADTLLTVRQILEQECYLVLRNVSAGRLQGNSLAELLNFPESSFRALFRMQKTSFNELVRILVDATDLNCWGDRRGTCRLPAEQIA